MGATQNKSLSVLHCTLVALEYRVTRTYSFLDGLFVVCIGSSASAVVRIQCSMHSAGEQKVMLVLVAVEGGPGTLQTVHDAITKDTPVVLVTGMGRAADIIAFAYNNSRVDEEPASDARSQGDAPAAAHLPPTDAAASAQIQIPGCAARVPFDIFSQIPMRLPPPYRKLVNV